MIFVHELWKGGGVKCKKKLDTRFKELNNQFRELHNWDKELDTQLTESDSRC